MTIRHMGHGSAISLAHRGLRRPLTMMIGAIVGSSSMIGAIVANQVHFNETGSALIPFIATVAR